jgi:hypothetical protein
MVAKRCASMTRASVSERADISSEARASTLPPLDI